ncbi:MAG: c-type cytochrome [Proteobacteria bacterium]|nr:c-type cytochrome [Pseudomonadota bacterium]
MNIRMAAQLPALALLLLASAPLSAQKLFVDDSAATFTDEQVARGQAAYGRVCVSCHGAALEGGQFGPTLKGDAFADHWRSRTRAAFSEQVRATMPPRGLGMLSGQAYTDIESFILQANGLATVGGPSAAARHGIGSLCPAGRRAGRPEHGQWSTASRRAAQSR